MAVINILDDNTINQIAAGEVVERPVSVVKELVENAMDAGADSISVDIKEGGIGYIRVTDNGCGIEKEYIKTAFLRHATSKINNALDLLSIKSLGFRGEALSSIACVSQTELLTKTKDDFLGTRYVINGGKEERLEDIGIPNGTTIIVRNLFYNTPARRKFLKSPQTEANLITSLMEKLILSHPDISFKFSINQKVKLSSVGNGDIKTAIFEVFGKSALNSMIEVDLESEHMSLKGYVAKPEYSRGNRNYEYFFVNNRLVKNQILQNALENAYKSFLMLHRYPFSVLYLTIDPAEIDVNVHPAKTEIKFIYEDLVTKELTDAVFNTLNNIELIPDVSVDIEEGRIKSEIRTSILVETTDRNIVFEPFENKNKEIHKEVLSVSSEKIKETANNITVDKQLHIFDDSFVSNDAVKRHNIIGQLFDTYWLVEYDKKLYIIDQHAAHEKVLYERIQKQIKMSSVTSQYLSPPIVVSLSKSEEEVLLDNMEAFNKLGFEIEHFGGSEYSLRGVPAELFRMSEKDYFLAVLDNLSEKKSRVLEEVLDRMASMACKAAVKGNMKLSEKEARALIDELLYLENPYNCPHGRPTIVAYSKDDIEKMFKRIV